MFYKQTTQIPNFIFDTCLAELKPAELKILLWVFRQTNGWIDKRTGKRKERDRISSLQFRRKTGLSKRVITTSIQSLVAKKLLLITNGDGSLLHSPADRKGKTNLYYSANNPMQILISTNAQDIPGPVQKMNHNKTKIKLTNTKLITTATHQVGELLLKRQTYFFRNN